MLLTHDLSGDKVVTRTRLDTFIEERITQPLGMVRQRHEVGLWCFTEPSGFLRDAEVDSGFQIPRDKRLGCSLRFSERYAPCSADAHAKPSLHS